MAKKKLDDEYFLQARYKRQIQKLEPIVLQPKKKNRGIKGSQSQASIMENHASNNHASEPQPDSQQMMDSAQH